jgi:hypothetical protein
MSTAEETSRNLYEATLLPSGITDQQAEEAIERYEAGLADADGGF